MTTVREAAVVRHGIRVLRPVAGISTGGLFHYFPTKRAIVREISEQDGADNAATFAEARGLSPWDGALLVVDRLCAPALGRAVAGLVVEIVAQASRDPELGSWPGATSRWCATSWPPCCSRPTPVRSRCG